MKNLFFIFIFSFSILSCKKESTTKADITVTDALGVKKTNFTVYQISDTKWNLYGEDPFFKDAQSVTNTDGVASFIIDNLNFSTSSQATIYFFCEYTIGSTDKTKSVGITFKKGETKAATLVLN